MFDLKGKIGGKEVLFENLGIGDPFVTQDDVSTPMVKITVNHATEMKDFPDHNTIVNGTICHRIKITGVYELVK